jgi:IS30 family transposase
LHLAWTAANHICAKRLIPFLPTLVESVERHGHLQLTAQCRTQLRSMSPATADRILGPYRKQERHGISTTRSGTLLKKQIPIRTFQDWNETQPGFMEADLVAHCGTSAEGSYLYTLTLTDIATGWTECLPLLNRGQEAVVAALKRARQLLPFPLLGIDTDNGVEFINMELMASCEAEQINFTRGRPRRSNDQCSVEQKHGQIVRKARRL